jgi:hypothetical protein
MRDEDGVIGGIRGVTATEVTRETTTKAAATWRNADLSSRRSALGAADLKTGRPALSAKIAELETRRSTLGAKIATGGNTLCTVGGATWRNSLSTKGTTGGQTLGTERAARGKSLSAELTA